MKILMKRSLIILIWIGHEGHVKRLAKSTRIIHKYKGWTSSEAHKNISDSDHQKKKSSTFWVENEVEYLRLTLDTKIPFKSHLERSYP